MQWIKASERLPDMETVLHLKDNIGIKRLGNFFQEDGGYKCYIQPNGAHEGYYIRQINFDHLFWLDESPSGTVSEAAEKLYPYPENDLYKEGDADLEEMKWVTDEKRQAFIAGSNYSQSNDVGEWQICPKCNGDGNLLRYNSPALLTTDATAICDVCHGNKIIAKPIHASKVEQEEDQDEDGAMYL